MNFAKLNQTALIIVERKHDNNEVEGPNKMQRSCAISIDVLKNMIFFFRKSTEPIVDTNECGLFSICYIDIYV